MRSKADIIKTLFKSLSKNQPFTLKQALIKPSPTPLLPRKLTGLLFSTLLLSACMSSSGNGGDGSVDIQEPVTKGIQQDQHFSLEKGAQETFIMTNLVDSGKQLVLVGGDALVAETSATREVLTPNSDFSNYSSHYPQNLDQENINFSIQYLPSELREDRWYPADEIYVDTTAGSHSNFNWSHKANFPAAITLTEPMEGDYYYSPDDFITIAWAEDSELQENDNIQIWAVFGCYQKSLLLYPNPTARLSGNAFSVKIQELFDELGFQDPTSDEDTLRSHELVDLRFFDQHGYYSSYSGDDDFAIFFIGRSVKDCTISIHALVERLSETNSPFIGGTISHHHTHTVTINFINRLR